MSSIVNIAKIALSASIVYQFLVFFIPDFDSFVTINPVPSREKVGNSEVHIFCMLWPEATGEKVLSKMQCTKKNFARV